MASGELVGPIKSLAQDFQHLSVGECKEVLGDLLNKCAELGPELEADDCKALLSFAISVAALRGEGQRALQWQCLELIRCAGKATKKNETASSRADLQAFFFKLAKKEVKVQRVWKPRVMVLLLQYILKWVEASGLQHAPSEADGGASADVVNSLLQSLYGDMSRCDRWSPRWKLKATRALQKVLRTCPGALEHAAAAAKKEDPPAVLVAAVAAECGKADAPQRAQLVEAYSKNVIEAKQPASGFTVEAWGPILAVATPEEIDKMLPVATRMVKRQPGPISFSFPAMASQLSIDLSAKAKDILDPLAPDMFKVADKRARARLFVSRVTRKCEDQAAAIGVAEAWLESLKKAAKADEKQALLMSIAALINSLKEGPDVCADSLLKLADPKGQLVKVAAEDANEDSRVWGYRILGAVASKLPASSQGPVVQEIVKVFADKKAVDKVKVAALEVLRRVVPCRSPEGSAPEPQAWAASMIDKILPITVVAATKPPQRYQSILAWSIFGSYAGVEPDALTAKLKKEHLAILKDSSSFANTVSLIFKAQYAEIAAQAEAWRAVLRGDIGGVPSMKDAAESIMADGSAMKMPPTPFADSLPIARTGLVLLAALHQSRPDASSGPNAADDIGANASPPAPADCIGLLSTVKALPDGDAQALLLLLAQALVAWFGDLAKIPPKDRQVHGFALRGALFDICAASVCLEAPLRPETGALLVLAAHHPVLSTSAWPTKRVWTYLHTKGGLAKYFQRSQADVWGPIRAFVASGRLIPLADTSMFRETCLRIVSVLDLSNVDAPEAVAALKTEITNLLGQCTTSLHSEDVAKEKDKNVCIYFAQEGKLWREEGTYIAEERENKNLKHNKFLKGVYGDDDLELIVEKKPTPAAKPASKTGAKAKGKASSKSGAKAAPSKEAGHMTREDVDAAEIAEQSESRARIRKYVEECSYALEVLGSLAIIPSNVEVLEDALVEMVPHFMALLKSPLTVLQARRSMRALVCSVVSTANVRRRDLLPDALMVVAKGWQLREPSAAGTPGDSPACETMLDSVDTHHPLPSAALTCVLPTVLKTLAAGLPALQKVCGRALVVLEKQLKLGAEVPQSIVPEVLDALGVALLALSSQRPATQAALLAASRHLIATEEHLAQVANMFFTEEEAVRTIVIAALSEIQHNFCVADESLDARPARAVLRLGALDGATQAVAQAALEELAFEADEQLLRELLVLTNERASMSKDMHELIAKAVAEALQELQDPHMTALALDLLTQSFREDGVLPRLAVARCLEKIFASCLDGPEQVVKSFRFLLTQALCLTTSDTPEAVELRDVLLSAGIALIEKQGDHADELLAAVEKFEDSGAGAAAGESARLGVAVFLGALSKHLGGDHPKVRDILPRLQQRLLEEKSTPSVQNAIVKVLPPLMKQNKERATEILHELMDIALEKKTHEMTRRGAAMGLGATVKGLSIQAVSQHGVLKRIEEACENKKDATVRQGALMCLEGLTLNLGRLFDPYVVSSLPLLLAAFADSSRNVQESSKQAARAMMSQLSGPGVKQVLKPLMDGIKDPQWRTKLGSIELLASMTNCLPKQLAASLPTVVPALCTVINDQNAKVKQAARDALDKIGSIITSPELRALAPDLIEALTDGAQFEHITKKVLDQLLGTSFVHHIDAASLSLVCPLVQRALKERSAEMKRKGAQIVGSMVLLIKDPKDIQPYLPLLLPQLKETLLDPIPDVRATAAKAFGTLANGLPEDMLGDVMPWLFEKIQSAGSAVERSGAAHGLSEVLMAMGTDRIEKLLPDILANASKKDAAPEVKEGYLGLFVYLPAAMGSAFQPYIHDVMSAVLSAQGDDTGSVRDTALKAAQVLTKTFGAGNTSELLEPLEDGVFDVDWRIRHASVTLMGQLIEQILRAHRISTTNAELMQCEVLPKEWRAHMLASLYIVRSDENPTVRTACAQVWKAFVQNTPRVLKELLPSLMKLLIANLASPSREKQRVAARCVGDLVAKLGERVMPELMPIFMDTLKEGDAHVREGVCIGLAELINATTKQMLADYLPDLIPAICEAIIDDEDAVRNSASQVVALLHGAVGSKATTEIVNWVINQLDDPEEAEHDPDLVLSGLEQLMMKQPGAVLPIVLSELTEPTDEGWTVPQVKALASITAVPDSHTVHKHLSEVFPVFIEAAGAEDDELKEAALASAGRVMDRVEQAGLNMLFTELVKAVQDTEDARRRAVGAKLFSILFETTQLDFVSILQDTLPAILPPALADTNDEALAAGVAALNGIVKKCKKEELAPYLAEVRSSVLKLITDPETGKEDPSILLPGLCKHGGLEPLYPIYQHGLMFGSAEQRELAAKGLGELVDHTSEAALKPYVVKITGPLIRIVGDRFPSSVKKAIVDTLLALLIRGGATLKPFLPQLQTTYVKCLADPSEAVRQKAAESLGTLVRLSARTEPLINELNTGLTTHADPQVRTAMCIALGEVLLNVPQPATEATQEKLMDSLLPRALGEEESSPADRQAAAWALAITVRRHKTSAVASVLNFNLKNALMDTPERRQGGAWCLAGLCWCQMPQLPPLGDENLQTVVQLSETWLPELLNDSDPGVRAAASAILAGSALLRAEASLPWEGLLPSADKLAALVSGGPAAVDTPGRFTPDGMLIVLRAMRHFGAAAAKAGKAPPVQFAVAAAARGLDKCGDVAAEAAERALAVLLVGGGSAVNEAQVKSALEKIVGPDPVGGHAVLSSYGSKRLKLLAQHASDTSFGWDF